MRLTKIFIVCCLLPIGLIFCARQASAQINIEASAGYISLDAEAWNKAIQTFNTSRPWLNEQQELFSAGFGVNVAASMPIDPGLRVGAGYDFSSSTSQAEPFESGVTRELNLTIQTISAHLEVQPFVLADSAAAAGGPFDSPLKHLYLQVGLGFNFAGGEAQYGGNVETANGVESDFSGSGIGINIGLGYRVPLTDMIAIQLNGRLNWITALELDGFSPAINNTPLVGLQSESAIVMITTGLGVQISL